MNNSKLERINKYYYQKQNEKIDIDIANAEDDCKLLSHDFKNRLEIIHNSISLLNNETNIISNILNNNTAKKKNNNIEDEIKHYDFSNEKNKELNPELIKKLDLIDLIKNNVNNSDEITKLIESKKINYIIDVYKKMNIEVQSNIVNSNKFQNERKQDDIHINDNTYSCTIPLSSYSLTLLLREKIDTNISQENVHIDNNNLLENIYPRKTMHDQLTENSIVKRFKITNLLKLINPYSFDFDDNNSTENIYEDNTCNNIEEEFDMDSEKSNFNDNFSSFINDDNSGNDNDTADDYFISVIHLSKESNSNNDNTKKGVKTKNKINNSSKRKIDSNIIDGQSNNKNIKLCNANGSILNNISELKLFDFSLIHQFNVKNGRCNIKIFNTSSC